MGTLGKVVLQGKITNLEIFDWILSQRFRSDLWIGLEYLRPNFAS